MSRAQEIVVPTLAGHPAGLFTLFFTEMWERFSFYGMRALLTLYMIKGFLEYSDDNAYRVYGAYTALVYMTPFFGGIIADRLLGSRRSVILGGILMAAGQLLLTYKDPFAFFSALGLLICGNGFFKPNISTMVGSLYPARSKLRDAGFTIFYIGINLGAAAAPLLCSLIGETYGYHKGFGLAAIGMLLGVAVFVAPNVIAQFLFVCSSLLIGYSLFGNGLEAEMIREYAGLNLNLIILGLLVLGGVCSVVGLRSRMLLSPAVNTFGKLSSVVLILAGAGAACYGMLRLYNWDSNLIALIIKNPGEDFTRYIDVFVVLYLGISALVSCIGVLKGGLPAESGLPPADNPLTIRKEWLVYALAIIAVPVFTLFVSGFDPTNSKKGESFSLVDKDFSRNVELEGEKLIEQGGFSNIAGGAIKKIGAVFLGEFGTPAGICLLLACVGALVYILMQMNSLSRIAHRRMVVALILTFFGLVFWALFEQAGSSINVFTDRNVNRLAGFESEIVQADIGRMIELQPTQAQLGFSNGDTMFTMDALARLRNDNSKSDFTIPWQVAEDNVGMKVSRRDQEVGAGKYQAVNPAYILIFGLAFTVLWSWMAARNIEPSTPTKFFLGLLQLGLGFLVFWYGATLHDARGMVWLGWIFIGYLLHTTGELCLSPVGLSAMTKLSARHLVATMMGIWFLGTAMSQFLGGVIAQFTQVKTADGSTPPPIETVMLYGNVYGILGILGIGMSLVALCMVPLLKKWMYENEVDDDEPVNK